MGGKPSQAKGRTGERELTGILRGYGYPVEPGRPVSFGSTPDITGLPGIHIECKRNERLNIMDAMNQAERDAERFQDGAPTVFHRRNRSPWLVTMKLVDWINLYKRAEIADFGRQKAQNPPSERENDPQIDGLAPPLEK